VGPEKSANAISGCWIGYRCTVKHGRALWRREGKCKEEERLGSSEL